MRCSLFASSLILAALTVALLPAPSHAQGRSEQLPLPPGGFKPPPEPPPAPIKPYKPVAVTLPGPYGDPSFVAFRKQLAEIAQRKDRAALAKLVVAQGFFWMQEPGKDSAEKGKSGLENLANVIDLDAKDGSGWDALADFASETTAAQILPDRPGMICAPAGPTIDPKAFQALIEATQTEPMDWGYPAQDGVEVRGAAKPNAPVIDKLGMVLIRVLPDNAPAENGSMPPFLHVATPSGKAGYVLTEAIASPGNNELCYAKDANGWKIAGFLGGSGGED
jgi:hypothetical protein